MQNVSQTVPLVKSPGTVATNTQFVTFIALQMQRLSSAGNRLNHHYVTSFGDRRWQTFISMKIFEIITYLLITLNRNEEDLKRMILENCHAMMIKSPRLA